MDDRSAAPDASPDRTTRATRMVALASAVALVALSIGWELVWARLGHGTLVLKALPLVIALPGLSMYRMTTYRWLSLAIWLYVAEAVVRIADRPPANWLAAIELALSLLLFAACATQVRWRHTVARRRVAAAALVDAIGRR